MAQDRRGEGRRVSIGAEVVGGDLGEDGGCVGAGGSVGDVCVGGGGGFEGEADEFAAAGDGGPVDEFVGGRGGGLLAF